MLRTERFVLRDAFEAFLEDEVHNKHGRAAYEKIDKEAVKGVLSALKKRTPPDVLTLYLSGADQYAHGADEGPDQARTSYLKEIIDPLVGSVVDELARLEPKNDRYLVLVSDHGHTEVLRDDVHSLAMNDKDDPPEVVRKAGFRLRPFKLDVDPKADFQAVLAYQGAMAYVYAADRSTCVDAGQTCAWEKPPRYEADVIPLADAFYQANRDGALVPALRGTLDMILVRHPKPVAEVDDAFEVYVGEGHSVPVGEYLKQNPHPTYVAFEERMRDLAVGTHGERAGDILLLAHNGDREKPEDRYYFAGRYRSWHGSPSQRDSDIPLIVSNPQRTADEVKSIVQKAIGESPRQKNVTDLLLALRALPR